MFFPSATLCGCDEILNKVFHTDSHEEKNPDCVWLKHSEHLDDISKSLQACTVTALVFSHPSVVHVA